jgi:hypothetical protein
MRLALCLIGAVLAGGIGKATGTPPMFYGFFVIGLIILGYYFDAQDRD